MAVDTAQAKMSHRHTTICTRSCWCIMPPCLPPTKCPCTWHPKSGPRAWEFGSLAAAAAWAVGTAHPEGPQEGAETGTPQPDVTGEARTGESLVVKSEHLSGESGDEGQGPEADAEPDRKRYAKRISSTIKAWYLSFQAVKERDRWTRGVLRFASSTWPAISSGVTEDVVGKWQRRCVAVKSGSKKAILLAHAIVEIASVLRSVTASGVPLSANLARLVALKVIRRLKLEHLVAQKPQDTLDGTQRKLQLSTTWLRSLVKNAGMTFRKGTTDMQTASFTAAEIEEVRLVPQLESWGFHGFFYGFPRFLRVVGRASRGTDQFATQVAVDCGATFGEAGECVELRRNCCGHAAPRLFGLGEQRAEKDRSHWHSKRNWTAVVGTSMLGDKTLCQVIAGGSTGQLRTPICAW